MTAWGGFLPVRLQARKRLKAGSGRRRTVGFRAEGPKLPFSKPCYRYPEIKEALSRDMAGNAPSRQRLTATDTGLIRLAR